MAVMAKILIVEDDLTFALMLKTRLEKKGFLVTCATTVSDAKKQLSSTPFDLILSDLRLPDHDGFSLLEWKKETALTVPLIMMTHYADIQTAVQAIKSGAADYIAKPVNPEELLAKINEAIKKPAESTQLSKPDQNNPNGTSSSYLEGNSDIARQLYEYVGLVAPTNMSVLINGASGTGKEHIAQKIHQLSNRRSEPFVAVDCGAIPKELAASEFFGHIKGSFTGAIANKTGAFVAADRGTLFLDEIGNLGYETQIQLLRALQEHKIKPIGSNTEINVDVRLIAATNENLEQAIEKGTFREDLYHRINEFTLQMPTLRERPSDILLFADFFLDQANRELNKQVIGFNPQASALILRYTWPGNLRQMKNVIKRATLLTSGDYISPLELAIQEEQPVTALRNEDNERKLIKDALQQCGNNKSKAAQLLQIDRKTLYNKLKQFGLE